MYGIIRGTAHGRTQRGFLENLGQRNFLPGRTARARTRLPDKISINFSKMEVLSMEEYKDLVRGFLSERAYAFRIRSGLTQEVMAERMRISCRAYSDL